MQRFNRHAWIGGALLLLSLSGLTWSFRAYGLAAQEDILVVMVAVLLLLAGVLLGRIGLWVVLACCLPLFAFGAWQDARHLGTGWRDVMSDASPIALGASIIALILDRLIGRVQQARNLSRDLALVCLRLEREIGERELAYQQLAHSQRVDALGRLASNVAHDFNNLLGVIRGYAYYAGLLAAGNAEVGNLLKRMDAATQRGEKLTSKLLTLARSNEYLIEICDVNEVMRELWPLLQQLFAPGTVLLFEPCMQPAQVRLDRAGFESVLLNLARNASDALQDRNDGVFRLYSRLRENAVDIIAEDNGHGMAPEVAARAFEPFFSTKPQGRGSGIGLATTDRVVTEAGGDIRLDTAVGAGARFTLSLPLVEL